jgi:outer membrane receptor protein involved in Fe transport
MLPLDELLAELSRRWGYSFIFDSRLAKGRRAAPIDTLLPPEIALERSLRSANLSLYRINEKTFAIRSPASQSAAPVVATASVVAPTPILTDAIIVTAAATAPFAGIGSPNLISLDEEMLALLDAVKPAEVIYDLPQSFSTFTPANTMLLGALSGISLVDLRGLSPARTLVLVNGRRRTVTPGGNQSIVGVDLNAIAEPFLERIEVIAAPGGAVAGPEAVAGSINFVTKKVRGVEAGARYGVTQRGDAREISVYALAGGLFADGAIEVSAGINVTSEEGLIGADRAITSVSWGLAPNGVLTPGLGGSSFTPKGMLAGAILINGQVAPFPVGPSRRHLDGDGGLAPFLGPGQTFTTSLTQQFIVPSDRGLGYFSVTAGNGPVEAFADAQFAWTSNDSQLAAMPSARLRGADPRLGDAVAVPLNHPTVPAAVADLYAVHFGGVAEEIIVERRYVELGPRIQENKRRYVDVNAGVRLKDAGNASAEFAYRFGRASVDSTQRNLLDKSKMAVALDDGECAATPGCAPIDLFRLGGISPQAANFIRAVPLQRMLSVEEHELRARVTLEFEDVLAESLRLSAGTDFRRTILSDRNTSPDAANTLGAFINDEPSGKLNTIEAFTTIEIPVFRSDALGDLDLSLAGRVSASSEYRPAFNFEAATEYSPLAGIDLFAHVHLGRRPPNIMELFGSGPAIYDFFSDPCGAPIGALPAVVSTNCFGGGRLSVEPGFTQTAQLARATVVGNPGVDPERVNSQAYGASISPSELWPALPGKLKLSATWLAYEITDQIAPAANPIGECLASTGLDDASCGDNPFTGLPLVRRDPNTDQITHFESLIENRGRLRWQGVDLALDYFWVPRRLGPIDRVWINGLHTIALRADLTDLGETAPISFKGQVTDPEHVSRVSIGAQAGQAALNFYIQRRGSVKAPSGGPFAPQVLPAATLFDVTVRLRISESVIGTATIENLTDEIAPVVAAGSVGNVFPEYYDLLGRRFSIGLKGAF